MHAVPDSSAGSQRDDSGATVALMLSAHAERRWLTTQVAPLLEDLEARRALPDDERSAALDSLRTLWSHAERHAADTDAALARVELADAVTHARATGVWSFHAAVSDLRGSFGGRAEALLSSPAAA